MPQSSEPSSCGDYYCDANTVCGVACAEIDLMEANQVAFVSTVHVADDSNGDGFGQGHYVIPQARADRYAAVTRRLRLRLTRWSHAAVTRRLRGDYYAAATRWQRDGYASVTPPQEKRLRSSASCS